MNPWVEEVLSNESQPMDVSQLLTRVKMLVKISRDEMSRFYDSWDCNDRTYRGIKKVDEDDKAAARRNEPMKFALPITYTQIDTFVSYGLSVFNQRDYFFELGGASPEDEKAGKVGQMVLENNLEYNNFRYQKLKQFLTDIAKYGVGVFKYSWKKDEVTEMVTQRVPVQAPGMETIIETQEVPQTTLKYAGNWIVSITPFRFFPDPRLPLTRFQEGEFCASEDEYSRSMLLDFEKQGLCAGTEWIPDLAQDQMVDRRHFGILNDIKPSPIMTRQKMYVILTEVQVWLNPAKTTVGGKPVDETNDQLVLYVIWYANDSRIVRLEPLNNPAKQFTFAAAQYDEDLINFINQGMADRLGPMQDVVDWLINSRITNVRKVISNQLIVDPKGIEIQDLRDRKPVIRLKPAVQGTGTLDRWIKQLPLTDVTQTHLKDIEFIKDYSQETSGIVDNLMGQYSPGRRSAREASAVNNNANTRIMTRMHSIWNTALLPLGHAMLDNCRVGMDQPAIVRVIGKMNAFFELKDGVQSFMTVDPVQLAGNYDFLIFDGTLPSTRSDQAAILQQLLEVIMTNPEAALIFGYDPQLLISQILEYKGIRNADQYKLTPGKTQQLIQLLQAGRNIMAPQPAPGAVGQRPNNGGQQRAGQSQGGPGPGASAGVRPHFAPNGAAHSR